MFHATFLRTWGLLFSKCVLDAEQSSVRHRRQLATMEIGSHHWDKTSLRKYLKLVAN